MFTHFGVAKKEVQGRACLAHFVLLELEAGLGALGGPGPSRGWTGWPGLQ